MVKSEEEIKKIRRKIEDKLRKEFTSQKIISLAILLDIEIENLPQKIKK